MDYLLLFEYQTSSDPHCINIYFSTAFIFYTSRLSGSLLHNSSIVQIRTVSIFTSVQLLFFIHLDFQVVSYITVVLYLC